MALEKKWLTISPVLLVSDGTSLGLLTIADTAGFHDKQLIVLKSNTAQPSLFQIKRVISASQMIVGPNNNKVSPNDFSDVSAFKVIDNAQISATEQDKLAMPTEKDHYFAVYESSPINADRVILTDAHGNFYDAINNPFPVSGNISISPISYRKTEISYDSDDNPIDIKKYTGSLLSPILAEEKVIAYDSNGNPITITKVFP
jgi:hypothetical protein